MRISKREAIFLLASVCLWAESPQPSNGSSKGNSTTIPIFDGNFFDKKPAAPAAEGKGERPVGEDPNYNSEQNKRWREQCSEKMKQGMGDYRNCFNKAKTQELNELKMKMDRVEQKQSLPMNNVPAPVLEYQKTPGDGEND